MSEKESTAFELLHPLVQRWIWEQNWNELRDVQEEAVKVILKGKGGLVICAATASGKTEAALLPIVSRLRAEADQGSEGGGIKALYISPLKALINDQFGRMEDLCENLEIPVSRWHGDVGAGKKKALIKNPQGILLITPESLEALLMIRGTQAAIMFAGLQYVVIDELHAFIGTERGAQLQSLLARVSDAGGADFMRIGLSATLGDPQAGGKFLRKEGSEIIQSTSSGELLMQIRGYTAGEEETKEAPREDGKPVESTGVIADDLFNALRGSNNLIFANSRRNVEIYTDLLAQRCALAGIPPEFVAHHGNLSKELREDAEKRLKEGGGNITAVCTSTLELGIDIGLVESVAQVGAPYEVRSLRQRLGRSGRRGGPMILRMYIPENTIEAKTPLAGRLRTELVQAVAMADLLVEGYTEKGTSGGLHLSTLAQQILSLCAQKGGVSPGGAWRILCKNGAFGLVTAEMFEELLRSLASKDLLVGSADGLMLLGEKGERAAGHWSFFAAFKAAEEYRLISGGKTIGTMPIDYPLSVGSLVIFAGRRWKVTHADTTAKTVTLEKAGAGVAPMFSGEGGAVETEIRQKMLQVYESSDERPWLNKKAKILLAEGRANFKVSGLAVSRLIPEGGGTLMAPFAGDRALATLALLLGQAGIDCAKEGMFLTAPSSGASEVAGALENIAQQEEPDAEELALLAQVKAVEKNDWMLSENLLNQAYAARNIDAAGAARAARTMITAPK